MHVIVAGCGRVGSTVARELMVDHDVVVVDRDKEAFGRLGDDFTGATVTGVAFDREVLASTGLTADSAVMAVTSGDNSNILIARVARETFRTKRVVARIYDPRRAAIYERLGIPTVASVAWTAGRAIREVLPLAAPVEWSSHDSGFVLVGRRVPAAAAGMTSADLDAAGVRLALVTRAGTPMLPAPTTLLQEDDVVQLMTPADRVDELDQILSHGGGHR